MSGDIHRRLTILRAGVAGGEEHCVAEQTQDGGLPQLPQLRSEDPLPLVILRHQGAGLGGSASHGQCSGRGDIPGILWSRLL